MNADQRLTELFGQLSNFERTRTIEVEWSLDAMIQMLAVLQQRVGPRPETARWVQVGGSKGKGTTALYLEALARQQGRRTGVFTSPHLQQVTERVRIDGKPVAAEQLVAALEPILAEAQAAGLQLSFFEAMTLAAVSLFCTERVGLAVFEVGLGGRLDATTAVPVDAAILTRIELEHCDLLGDTLAAIATEKAFVMRAGRPAWVQRQPATEAVLLAHAAAVGALVQPAVRIQVVEGRVEDLEGTLEVGGRELHFLLPGASEFELAALALAVGCLRCLFPEAEFKLLPVPRPSLPGRFEVLPQADGWPLVLDGAHTLASLAAVARELQRRYPAGRVVALFATARDKSWRQSLAQLCPRVSEVLVTEAAGIPGEDPAVIVAWLAAQGVVARVVADPEAGLRCLLECEAVRLVTGSFYLVGEIAGLLRARRFG